MSKPVSAEDIRNSIKCGWQEASGFDNCDEAKAELAFLDLMERKADAFDKLERLLNNNDRINLFTDQEWNREAHENIELVAIKVGTNPTSKLPRFHGLLEAVKAVPE